MKYIEELFYTQIGKSGLLIGNGESRKNVDLEKLSEKYDFSFGCNILYKDFIPNYILTKGAIIMNDMLKLKLHEKSTLIVQTYGNYVPEHPGLVYKTPGTWFKSQFSTSGHTLLFIMIKMGLKKIGFVGMDCDKSNVYRGEQWYKGDGGSQGIWHERKKVLENLMNCNPHITWRKE